MAESHELQRAKSGDRAAFGRLVETYQARLRAYAARYVESSDDVFDLVQDAFLDAFTHLDRFEADREFFPWLRTICLNRIRNFYRRRKTERVHRLAIIDEIIETEIIRADETAGDDSRARVEALKACMAQLTAPHRDLIELRFKARVAVNDIAARLSKSAANVSMILTRIKQSLGKCVEARLKEAQP